MISVDRKKLDAAIKEVGRELGMRRNVYKRWIEQGGMKREDAVQRYKDLEYAYCVLKQVRERQPGA